MEKNLIVKDNIYFVILSQSLLDLKRPLGPTDVLVYMCTMSKNDLQGGATSHCIT